jgi:hypothetical protein
LSASLRFAGTSTRATASWALRFIVSAIKPPCVARTPSSAAEGRRKH